jgi:formylmethanofuran dehydrogenase subunit C
VSKLLLRLRAAPDQRLDMSPLTPQRLAGMSRSEIEKIALQTTRRALCVGDIFDVSGDGSESILLAGGSDRFDRVGEGMSAGLITVEGDIGNRPGRRMAGGRLVVKGNVGHWAASGMTAGMVEIDGAAGDYLGGPLAGEIQGMNGGTIVVRGDVGDRAGDRLRRGMIIVEGNAGGDAGARMLAGTLIVLGSVGPGAGYLLRRGTLALGAMRANLGPTFLDCGVHDLVSHKLMGAFVRPLSQAAAQLFAAPLRRYVGDTALLGKGEVFVSL